MLSVTEIQLCSELKEQDFSLRKTIVDLNELLQYASHVAGGSIEHGASKDICYALASSSSHVIKLPICY